MCPAQTPEATKQVGAEADSRQLHRAPQSVLVLDMLAEGRETRHFRRDSVSSRSWCRPAIGVVRARQAKTIPSRPCTCTLSVTQSTGEAQRKVKCDHVHPHLLAGCPYGDRWHGCPFASFGHPSPRVSEQDARVLWFLDLQMVMAVLPVGCDNGQAVPGQPQAHCGPSLALSGREEVAPAIAALVCSFCTHQ